MSVFIDSEKCKGCGICVSVCPVQAISIMDDKAFIDQRRCNECLQCLDECPTNAIYQISEKEISVSERQNLEPYSLPHTSSQSNQVLEVDKRKQQPLNRDVRLLDRIREVANNFFQPDAPYGRRRRVRKRGPRGQRGFRGGKSRH
jgi:NAD-dependent dihydropyrimidine dehydrogenase PreA subunit